MNKSVCLITGVGEGTGGHTAKKFAEAGYTVAMLARTPERLKKSEKLFSDCNSVILDGIIDGKNDIIK